jgi:hypothetical protein
MNMANRGRPKKVVVETKEVENHISEKDWDSGKEVAFQQGYIAGWKDAFRFNMELDIEFDQKTKKE